jgi:hypothetical protein
VWSIWRSRRWFVSLGAIVRMRILGGDLCEYTTGICGEVVVQ